MKYLACVLILAGGEEINLQYPEPHESYEQCLSYGHGMATEWMQEYWKRPDVNHQQLPLVQLRCQEQT